MSPILTICLGCGTLIPQGSGPRCSTCRTSFERERNRRRGPTVYHSRGWKQARAQVLARDEHRCRRCSSDEKLAVHHIVPPREGGAALDPSNLVTLCTPCHNQTDAERRRKDAIAAGRAR